MKSLSMVFREGDKVEARFRGKLRYYPGVIRRVNRDSTYDVDYSDGEKEVRRFYLCCALLFHLEIFKRSMLE